MTIIFLMFGALVLIFAFLTIQYSFLIPEKKGLPILMYHKISADTRDSLTIRCNDLEQQFQYLTQNKYKCLSFSELKNFCDKKEPVPSKSVIITFDDGYLNNKIYLLPLLEKYGLKATIFLPLSHLGKINVWDSGNEPLMDLNTVKELGKLPFIELGIHSFAHQNYKSLTIGQIDEDLTRCDEFLGSSGLNAVKALAYPYGGTHRKNPEMNQQMKEVLARHNYWFGLRIGNRINKPILKDIYELFRIDIKGTDSFTEFKIKIKKGRTKLF